MRSMFGDRFEVHSAGTEQTRVHPDAIAAMADIGVDISAQISKKLDGYSTELFDYIVTVCDNARESCPVIAAGGERIHSGFADPSGHEVGTPESREAFRQAREDIAAWLTARFG